MQQDITGEVVVVKEGEGLGWGVRGGISSRSAVQTKTQARCISIPIR